jgi:agmatine deiminase
VAGETVAAGYLNLYICNGAVIVPVCGADSDAEALAIIGRAYPGREVVAVPGAVLAYGGGGPHFELGLDPVTAGDEHVVRVQVVGHRHL